MHQLELPFQNRTAGANRINRGTVMIDRTSDPSAATGDPRQFLLMAVRTFVHEICGLAGLHRIALMGSLTTDKPTPKDADVLVTIDPGLELTDLARAARRIWGSLGWGSIRVMPSRWRAAWTNGKRSAPCRSGKAVHRG